MQPFSQTAKYPLIQLLFDRENRESLHEGTEYVRNIFRRVSWIVALRNTLQEIKSMCKVS